MSAGLCKQRDFESVFKWMHRCNWSKVSRQLVLKEQEDVFALSSVPAVCLQLVSCCVANWFPVALVLLPTAVCVMFFNLPLWCLIAVSQSDRQGAASAHLSTIRKYIQSRCEMSRRLLMLFCWLWEGWNKIHFMKASQVWSLSSSTPATGRNRWPQPHRCAAVTLTSVTANTRFPHGTTLYHLSCSRSM